MSIMVSIVYTYSNAWQLKSTNDKGQFHKLVALRKILSLEIGNFDYIVKGDIGLRSFKM